MQDRLEARRRGEGAILFFAFAACVPLANWLIDNVGIGLCPARTVPYSRRAGSHGAKRRPCRGLGADLARFGAAAARSRLVGGCDRCWFGSVGDVCSAEPCRRLDRRVRFVGDGRFGRLHAAAKEGLGQGGVRQQLGWPGRRQRGLPRFGVRQPAIPAWPSRSEAVGRASHASGAAVGARSRSTNRAVASLIGAFVLRPDRASDKRGAGAFPPSFPAGALERNFQARRHHHGQPVRLGDDAARRLDARRARRRL